MAVMALVTIVSLVIILPVNFFNGPKENPYDVNAFFSPRRVFSAGSKSP